MSSNLDSELISTMRVLMEKADGSISLRSTNLGLYEKAAAWEKLAICAVMFHKAAVILQGSLKEGSDTQKKAAAALARVANILDGLPGQEEMVSLYRSAPMDLHQADWVYVAREAALQWANDVRDYLEAAKDLKATSGGNETKQSKNDDSSCFIATACYGNPNHPDITILRIFRDKVLKKAVWGNLFIEIYYFISPPVANFITRQGDPLRKLIRFFFIGPLAKTAKWVNNKK